jgi:hypothetical protein
MRTLLFLLAISAAAFAQESPSRDGTANRDPNASSSGVKAYHGCVLRAGGKIALRTADGKQYMLYSREGRQLDSYLGQEVQLNASDVNPDDQSGGERSVSAGQPRNGILALNVEQIQKVSATCASPQ